MCEQRSPEKSSDGRTKAGFSPEQGLPINGPDWGEPATEGSAFSFLLGRKFRHFRCPPVRHADAFVPVGCPVIGLADMIVANLGDLSFNGFRMPFANFVERALCARSEPVTALRVPQ